MDKYIGTKLIEAKEMNLGDYNNYRGWKIPEDENPNREGYLVKYEKNHVTWSPKEIFEKTYNDINICMSFGQAIEMMKIGYKVSRKGWNGKGMYLYYVPENVYDSKTDVAKQEFGDKVFYCSYIAMKTVQDYVTPWFASQEDMLLNDWAIVE